MTKPFALTLSLIFGLSLFAAAQIRAQEGAAQPPAAPTALTQMPPGDPAAGRVKAVTCTGCHGIPGYVNVYPTYHVPKVAGQYARVTIEALASYRAGERDHPTMHAQALGLSNQDIADIAAYFRALAPEVETSPPVAVQGPVAELAQQLCASCHGKTGISPSNAYPILAGQHRDYLLRALKDYKSGARENAIMRGLVSTLDETDLERLAAYYAQQEYLRNLEAAEN